MASACSIIPEWTIFFGFNSAELSTAALSTIWRAGAARNYQSLPAACESFLVVGHTDTAEAALPGSKLDLARADAVRRALEVREAHVVQVEGRLDQQLVVRTGPGSAEPQNRRVVVKTFREAKGRSRCDPATKQEANPAACISEYGACYVELDDGTICNFADVPDPNPQRYSVIR